MMKKLSFKQGLYILAWITFISCMIVVILLPHIVSLYLPNQVFEIVLFIYLTLIPFFPLLWSVIKMSDMLKEDKPFSNLSLVQLKRISICAFIDCLLYIGGALYFKQFIYVLMIFVTLLVSLISVIISELVKNGIVLKEENELTI